MNPAKNIVTINGVEYDALTGNSLSGGKPYAARPVISDMVGPGHARSHPKTARHKTKHHEGPSGHASHSRKKPTKSQTLMRPGVKKPAHKAHLKQPKQDTPRLSPPINRERLARAKTISKSEKIKKFHRSAIPTIIPKREPLAVKEPPVVTDAQTENPPKNDWPVIDQFEKAVQEASSHLETFVETTARSRKNRKLAYALASLSVLFILGFGVYHFMPLAEVKLAGNQAGFSPGLPTYSPSGFGLANPVKSSYGQVTLSYKSRTDDREFNIAQSPSQWNSQSLVKNFLLASHPDYQTVRNNGQTIYTYGGSNATWVDGGIWYKVEGNSKLSQDQLLSIAHGL